MRASVPGSVYDNEKLGPSETTPLPWPIVVAGNASQSSVLTSVPAVPTVVRCEPVREIRTSSLLVSLGCMRRLERLSGVVWSHRWRGVRRGRFAIR